MTQERRLYLRGGIPLEGDVQVHGGKNTALPILAAALLCDEPVRIENLPDISDVRLMLSLMEGLGAGIERESASVVVVDPTSLTSITPDPRALPTHARQLLFAGSAAGQGGRRRHCTAGRLCHRCAAH